MVTDCLRTAPRSPSKAALSVRFQGVADDSSLGGTLKPIVGAGARSSRCSPKLRDPRPAEGLSLEELMLRYIDGDPEAFDLLYHRLLPHIRAMLRSKLRCDAAVDDAVQITLLKIHRARYQYRPSAPLLPWVLTIAKHVAFDELRRPARREISVAEQTLEQFPAPESPAPTQEDERAVAEAVRAAIAELPKGLGEVVRLHKLEGRTMAEVATRFDIKEGTARVRAHRGYKALAKRLLGFQRTR